MMGKPLGLKHKGRHSNFVHTDLVCSGRGAITGGGVASSSSSSSDTVATAGVSDTALEFCRWKGRLSRQTLKASFMFWLNKWQHVTRT